MHSTNTDIAILDGHRIAWTLRCGQRKPNPLHSVRQFHDHQSVL